MRSLPELTGSATPVRFPEISRDELANGLRVWSLPWHAVPVAAVALILPHGAAQDPPAQPGLAGLAADLIDEGAGGRDALEIADAFARLGTHLDVEVGQEATVLSFTALSRFLDPTLALLADVLIRPHLVESDLARIRQLRLNRLRQLRTSASAAADRAFLTGVFGSHPYGHGTLGLSSVLETASLGDVQQFHARRFVPAGATLVVAGDVPPSTTAAIASARLLDWRGTRATEAAVGFPSAAAPRLLLVDRPGAPQSELRIGHLGPPRVTPVYHALVTLNAALGGQFTSRINQNLREAKGYTYGVRTGFDLRRACGTFWCDTSVQSDATTAAIAEVLAEYEAVRSTRPIDGEELDRAKQALTRGYVRHFETPAQLVRSVVELVTYSLPDDTFDRFVPDVSRIAAPDVLDAAQRFVRPAASVVVVVGDAAGCRPSLAGLGLPVVDFAPEF